MKNTMIQVKIDNFEGPMDLLIHLIEKKKLKINEISISQIIDDYLLYINEQKNLNLKIKVEFLTMATELIEIKAYSILNKEKKEEIIENLEKKILEYKFFKEISTLFSIIIIEISSRLLSFSKISVFKSSSSILSILSRA